MDWNQFWKTVQDWVTNTGIKIVIAILILIVSFGIINAISKKIAKKADKKVEENKKIDKTLYRTLSYVTKIGLKILVVLALVGYLGIDTSGVTALLASLGVGVGLAINGTLSNFAGGVMLVFTRPFRVDDYIEALDNGGTVEDIHICYTKLRTPDNKVVYLPNGALSTAQIVNYSEKDTRRVDVNLSISYADDFEKAKKVVLEVCKKNKMILNTPAPAINIVEHGDSSINISAKVWCKNADYWDVKFYMLEKVKVAFDENGIEIPFNQLEVTLKK